MDAATLSEQFGAPVWLIERSAAARAKVSGSTVEDIYAAWAGATPSASASEPVTAETPESAPETEAAPPAATAAAAGLSGTALLTAVAEARGMPESLTERSAQARASAVGASLDDVLREWAEEEGLAASAPAAPASKAASSAKPAPEPAPSEPVDVGISGAELLSAVAEARGLPESLVERSAQARAETAGFTLESVLYEWAEEEGVIEAAPPAVPVTAKEAPAATAAPIEKTAPAAKVAAGLTGAALLAAVAEARGMPESLVERSAGARAKKTGVSVDDVLNEWAEEEGLAAAEPAPSPAAAAPAAAALSGAALLTALAEKRGMPESLVERSAKAKAKKTDSTVDAVLNEWAKEEGLVSSPSGGGVSDEGADGGGQAAPVATAPDEAPEPVATAEEPAAAAVAAPEPRKKLNPLALGAIAAAGLALLLSILIALVDVPTSGADAPWYNAGLDPFVAVIVLPAVVLMAVVGLAVAAWRPSIKPSIRRFALMALVVVVVAMVLFTGVGALLA
ncbi:MAG: hypothetical protein ABFS21_00650 [Actinomycetota bacterium]